MVRADSLCRNSSVLDSTVVLCFCVLNSSLVAISVCSSAVQCSIGVAGIVVSTSTVEIQMACSAVLGDTLGSSAFICVQRSALKSRYL